MADNAAKIADLEAVLDSGADSINVDGVATKVNHAAIRQRIAELKADDPNFQSQRPTLFGFNLSGF